MIYSFGINTDLEIDPKSIPYTEKSAIGLCTILLIVFLGCFFFFFAAGNPEHFKGYYFRFLTLRNMCQK